MSAAWYQVTNAAEVFSPALLIYPDRVERNIGLMLEIAGGPTRLRPHTKTHKLPEIVRLQQERGITKFKCATIAEAEMAAAGGAEHLVLAYQPVGPNIGRLLRLAAAYPQTRFAAIADNAATIQALGTAARAAGTELEVLLDLDCGMHRTGVAPGVDAARLYGLIAATGGLQPGGLHAYDGHICDHDVAARRQAAEVAVGPVKQLRAELQAGGLPVPRIVAGGSPTFPIYAQDPELECSPGTCLLWDAGYGALLPDLAFEPAAVVLTRVVSKPTPRRLCLDLGYKAIASEGPQPRVYLPELSDAVVVGHNEEHLVLETARAGDFSIGEVLYGIPTHICPTVALHAEAVVVRDGRAAERWRVVARDRQLTF